MRTGHRENSVGNLNGNWEWWPHWIGWSSGEAFVEKNRVAMSLCRYVALTP
jgi:hypothetical protein